MLYIILIGVIIFMIIKLSKSNTSMQIPVDDIVDKVTKKIEEKLQLKTVMTEQPKAVEPVIIVDKAPVTVFEKKEVITEIREDESVFNKEAVEREYEESISDVENEPELSIEDEKKPLSEIIKRRIHHRKVLMLNEQPMFHRLKEALPEYSVLPQVSFNSLVWSRSKYIRNRFNRKVCDFAICDETFKPIFVIELDDASHNGREQEDADRDCILNEAKIRVIRYKQTPEIEVIRKDLGL